MRTLAAAVFTFLLALGGLTSITGPAGAELPTPSTIQSERTAPTARAARVSLPGLCREHRTRYLLCAGGYAEAGGAMRRYQVRGTTPSGVTTTTLLSADSNNCSSLTLTFFDGNGTTKTILRVVTVNGTFAKTYRSGEPLTLTATLSRQPWRVRISQWGDGDGVGYAYLSGSAVCG